MELSPRTALAGFQADEDLVLEPEIHLEASSSHSEPA